MPSRFNPVPVNSASGSMLLGKGLAVLIIFTTFFAVVAKAIGMI